MSLPKTIDSAPRDGTVFIGICAHCMPVPEDLPLTHWYLRDGSPTAVWSGANFHGVCIPVLAQTIRKRLIAVLNDQSWATYAENYPAVSREAARWLAFIDRIEELLSPADQQQMLIEVAKHVDEMIGEW